MDDERKVKTDLNSYHLVWNVVPFRMRIRSFSIGSKGQTEISEPFLKNSGSRNRAGKFSYANDVYYACVRARVFCLKNLRANGRSFLRKFILHGR